MFRFNTLKVKDWCQHRDRTETFVPGTNGVIGSNGKGKSNLVTALFTAITGRVLVDSIQENINFEADKTIIEAEFIQNGVPGYIKRAFNSPRIDNNHHNRKDVTSTAELKFGDADKIKGASKVTAELERITGMSPRTIEDHIFVSQNKLDDLLFQRKSDRMKSFLTLIPGVERAEPLRTFLQNELSRYVEVQLASTSAEAHLAVDTIKTEVAQLEGQKVKFASELSTVSISKSMQVITKYKETVQAEQRLQGVLTELKNLEDLSGSILLKQAAADKSLSAALEEVETKRSTSVEAQAELKGLETNKGVYRMRKTTQAELDMLMAEIEIKPSPEVSDEPWVKLLPHWEAQLPGLVQTINDSRKVLQSLAKGDNCPTCNRPFEGAAEKRAQHTQVLAEYEPQERTCREEIRKLTAARDAYTKAKDQYTNWLKNSEVRLQQLTTTLEHLPVVQEPTEERIQLLTRLVNEYAQAVAQSKLAEAESKRWSDMLSNTTQKINVLEKTRMDLEAIVATRPSAEDLAEADLQQRRYEALNTNLATVSGRLSSKREELTRAEANLLRIEVAEARAKSIKDYRELLNIGRDVLHRDKLQHEVLTTYIQELDTLINRYLDLFGNPFAVVLDKEMDMACYFPNGYTCGTQRLSGGQKCVLSVAMRFAINELFAKDLGLLILDEPSSFMDATNIAYMGELMEKIHEVSSGVGVQTIVITHAQELLPCFESVIKVN